MTSKHYDIAIVGDSLTAQIVAALFAKQGNRVLFLSGTETKTPTWFHSSLFLEKILGIMGGRSCFVAQHPIQVISANSRLTVSNDIPLDEELVREFGTSGPEVSNWLTALNEQGLRLEELFLENGGLPWSSFKAAALFKLRCMHRRVNMSEMEQPIADQLERFSGPARIFLTDLLQGLSMTDVENLSAARAAILWAQARRPEDLNGPHFSQTLGKRFDQFHGAKAQLSDLKSLEFVGSRWTGGQLESGGRFTADNFLLGDKHQVGLFKAGQPIQIPCNRHFIAWKTDNLAGQLSRLLESRIICGGQRPLRLAIEETEDGQQGLILSSKEATKDDIRQQMEPVLPFAKYQLSEIYADQAKTLTDDQRTALSLTSLPIRAGKNLYWADHTALLPEMGGAGAALLAWTIFDSLSIMTKPD